MSARKKQKKLGNRSKWESHVKPRLATIRAWKMHGLTHEEIAKNLGVGISNFYGYQQRHKELREALRTGKEDSVAQVENALMKRAIGYEYEEVKQVTELPPGATKEADVPPTLRVTRIERTRKQMAPDVTAQIFFLTNRHSEKWRHKSWLEGPGATPPPEQHFHFDLSGMSPEQRRQLDANIAAFFSQRSRSTSRF